MSEQRTARIWKIKAMELQSGSNRYCSFYKRPDMTIYDSKVYDDIREAVSRCKDLNHAPDDVDVVRGPIPFQEEN